MAHSGEIQRDTHLSVTTCHLSLTSDITSYRMFSDCVVDYDSVTTIIMVTTTCSDHLVIAPWAISDEAFTSQVCNKKLPVAGCHWQLLSLLNYEERIVCENTTSSSNNHHPR